jgi:ABC-type nitrate/sulfonate/bicarbonate transport system substrate-binding protein
MRFLKSLILLFVVLSLAACQSGPAAAELAESMEMTFMAGYKPQANLPFVGVYVAQEKGFFAEEGLTVNIEHSPGGGEHLQLVATGAIQVTTQDAAVLLKRRSDPGLPLVSIALVGQRGQQAFAALKSSGIESLEDWQNKLVGFKGTPPPDLFAMLGSVGMAETDFELVNVGFDPRLLVEGKVDIYPVYKSNEPYLLKSWGYELNLWDAADYGVPTLGLTYVTSDETLANNKEMLTRFLRAAMKGIEYADANRDEAVQIVLEYAGPETNPEHMRFMLDAELVDMHSDITESNGLGWQDVDQWQALQDMLVEYETMAPVDVEDVFTTDILEAIH